MRSFLALSVCRKRNDNVEIKKISASQIYLTHSDAGELPMKKWSAFAFLFASCTEFRIDGAIYSRTEIKKKR